MLYDLKKIIKKLIPARTRAIGKLSLCNAGKGQGNPGEIIIDISSLRIGEEILPLLGSP